MAYVRERFRDAAGVLADYEFQVNHSEEEGFDFRRNLERTTTTSGVGFVRQQGDDSPALLRFTGTILHQNQYNQMAAYYIASQTRTIFFRDFTGTEYEVMITAWNPVRKRTLKNPRDQSINLHYFSYTLEMEVIA